MKLKISITVLMLCSFFICGCLNQQDAKPIKVNVEIEKSKIIACLNNETKSAFARKYNEWTQHWIHRDDISKTYINYVDGNFSESIGWEEISSFVKFFLEENPNPEPPPKLLDDINVRFYNNGAWVNYEQMDSLRGLKRESRLMEKQDGKWKIAGMHTTIYGFEKD